MASSNDRYVFFYDSDDSVSKLESRIEHSYRKAKLCPDCGVEHNEEVGKKSRAAVHLSSLVEGRNPIEDPMDAIFVELERCKRWLCDYRYPPVQFEFIPPLLQEDVIPLAKTTQILNELTAAQPRLFDSIKAFRINGRRGTHAFLTRFTGTSNDINTWAQTLRASFPSLERIQAAFSFPHLDAHVLLQQLGEIGVPLYIETEDVLFPSISLQYNNLKSLKIDQYLTVEQIKFLVPSEPNHNLQRLEITGFHFPKDSFNKETYATEAGGAATSLCSKLPNLTMFSLNGVCFDSSAVNGADIEVKNSAYNARIVRSFLSQLLMQLDEGDPFAGRTVGSQIMISFGDVSESKLGKAWELHGKLRFRDNKHGHTFLFNFEDDYQIVHQVRDAYLERLEEEFDPAGMHHPGATIHDVIEKVDQTTNSMKRFPNRNMTNVKLGAWVVGFFDLTTVSTTLMFEELRKGPHLIYQDLQAELEPKAKRQKTK